MTAITSLVFKFGGIPTKVTGKKKRLVAQRHTKTPINLAII